MTRTRHDIELAKKFMHLMGGHPPELEHLCNLVTTARLTLPTPGRDVGPWTYGVEDDGRYYLQSDDFMHDARLYIDGDFANDTQRRLYAAYLAETLSAAAAKPATFIAHKEELVPQRPPYITADEIKSVRERTGDGLMTVRDKLEKKRTSAMIGEYAKNGDQFLAEILDRLLGPVDHEYGN